MPISTLLKPHIKDLGGGFLVRRLLPAAVMRSVGPFVFFDHFGPVIHQPTDNFDVRPHPHIGLATVTYLFEGAMLHRDSLGITQRIEPGAINWMTAGRGVVHSERAPEDLRATSYGIHGLQLWAALPMTQEECDPQFNHTPAAKIPAWSDGPMTARVLIGSAFGLTSPVATFVTTLYVDFETSADATVTLPATNHERAIYCVSGRLQIGDAGIEPFQLAVLPMDLVVTINNIGAARFVLIGGEPLDGYRFMWWNFVSSRKERIEQAKQDWLEQRMGNVAGETEFIPLPEG
jgi:redox-sensitive bicupin YhaK (pirin superfamily)